ncbi:hypothetical protein NONO_c60520 [Nocardia nova SH22a]|uniref:Uncharacterized protein n=1 Tax=Nocardia nova SH22a TaxID=1415166 RepID=W5TPF9_9NOCA|nr:hypothetical protein [Nocardia nova]AHH20828.1 hypothetical protein NONO_c60520 [Nocardia nova SH22a]
MAIGSYMLEFDSRPDQGPMWIGPFGSSEAADREARRITGGVGEWSWSVVPLTAPEESIKYRKKPVEVEAEHFSSLNGERIVEWINTNGGTARLHIIDKMYDRDTDSFKPIDDYPPSITIETLEGTMCANVGDWMIQDALGNPDPAEARLAIDEWKRRLYAKAGGCGE